MKQQKVDLRGDEMKERNVKFESNFNELRGDINEMKE